jgi:hypothetical protein
LNPPDLGAAQRTLRTHPPSAAAGAGPHGFTVGMQIRRLLTRPKCFRLERELARIMRES